MGLDLDYNLGQTPLNEDEKEGLRIRTIATRAELDEFEQLNIEDAMQWVLTRSFKADAILSERFVMDLHKRMYGKIWNWAGSFRKSDKNLGVSKWQIPTALRALLDDTAYWVAHQTYPPDEIAVRFKHRIVSVHCFPNGNGRHSRLMADVIADKIFKRPVFSWGAASLVRKSDTRSVYISALREADKNNYAPLLHFARS